MTDMKIAVLMTCHNRCKKTLECLSHLYRSKEVASMDVDTYLVDDGCTDDTSVYVLERYPEVNVIEGNGELFWNRGMLLAWETALKNSVYTGVIWLNDDTILFDNALAIFKDLIGKNANTIVVGVTSATNITEITYGASYKHKLLESKDVPQACDRFNGNFVYIPTEVSNRIGLLDPYYRHSIGDFDYARRAYKNGYKCVVSPVIGTCDRNSPIPNWMKGSLIHRFKALYSPLGNNPFETFHFCKDDSYLKASFMFIYIHFRVLFSFFIKAVK